MRVVSLVPSVTETLLAWGVVPVAVTRFCLQPQLAAVGGTKDPDLARIVALAPDLVVMDDEENRRDDAEALEAAGLSLHVTHVRGSRTSSPRSPRSLRRSAWPGPNRSRSGRCLSRGAPSCPSGEGRG